MAGPFQHFHRHRIPQFNVQQFGQFRVQHNSLFRERNGLLILIHKMIELRLIDNSLNHCPPLDVFVRREEAAEVVADVAVLRSFPSQVFGGKESEGAGFISVDEVKSLIREGAARGIFNETEKELIHSVFEFADTPVKAVMIPRTEIHALNVHASLAEVAARARDAISFDRELVDRAITDEVTPLVIP